jgi:alpha-tubulin suppressor-like RCC1 family protein
MLHCNRATRAFPIKAALLLCAALVTDVAIAAPPTLQTVAVTPTAASIFVGQTQLFTATGTFSDGSTRVLGPAIADIAPGRVATCVLLNRGGVQCWGYNQFGQLGDGTTVSSFSPRRVKGISTATAVAPSLFEHVCALLEDGTVKCWGRNDQGQLGNGSMTWNITTPVAVTGIDSATSVAVGYSHSCALLTDGTVRCWGANGAGQLGDGANADSSIPRPVGGISTATALALGDNHSCALLESGTVQCWGYNFSGQLGNGSTLEYTDTPVTVVGIRSATAIAADAAYSCALRASGAVQCWGHGGQGQLGVGSYENSSIPVTVALTGAAVAVTTGDAHACAVMSGGDVFCWGSNTEGEFGDGSKTSSNTPVRVRIHAPVKLAAGAWHTCALLSDGAMRCWGYNLFGEVGNRRKTAWPILWPTKVIGTPGVVWKSSDRSKATITEGGKATARSVGNVTITATTAGFINDNAVLTVK